jgi:hypothetical protein
LRSIDEPQRDVDAWIAEYNEALTPLFSVGSMFSTWPDTAVNAFPNPPEPLSISQI